MEVTGTPVATKFGTMAGFTNNQMVQLGSLQLAFSLESMEKSVRTYKLRRPLHGIHHGGKPNVKTDCEIIVMVGLHVLEEPVEDRSWETDTVYQGNLTVMTRGSRMAGWKRYWAVLEGASLKLYDPDYQQQHDYDKVDVGSNGFCLAVDRQGVDMTHSKDFDMMGMDYNIYAFTDSAYLKEVWSANLEEAMDMYRENMDRRYQVRQAKRNRRVPSSLPSSSSSSSSSSASNVDGGGGQSSPEDDDEDVVDLINLKFVS
ncbi:hypothetical protein BG006_007401 [Podila minutissima]|uniref:PH domain-containing protein n=1 Tax=Podila minutissima TaxID=64525 RepID=A0A9P5VKN4_9FUNG|nr:hypothetical protein BG006_007401 [Podila minutissima]